MMLKHDGFKKGLAVAIALGVTLALTLFLAPAAHAKDQATHIHLSPLPLLIGALKGGADFKVDEKWTVGPSALIWNTTLLDYKVEGRGLGFRGAYYFRNQALETGPYLSGEFSWTSVKVAYTSSFYGSMTGEASGYGISGLAGYHWVQPSGFTFRVGVGLAVSNINRIQLKDSSGTVRDDYSNRFAGGIAYDIDVGWVF